jgi:hypothetical protein
VFLLPEQAVLLPVLFFDQNPLSSVKYAFREIIIQKLNPFFKISQSILDAFYFTGLYKKHNNAGENQEPKYNHLYPPSKEVMACHIFKGKTGKSKNDYYSLSSKMLPLLKYFNII